MDITLKVACVCALLRKQRVLHGKEYRKDGWKIAWKPTSENVR